MSSTLISLYCPGNIGKHVYGLCLKILLHTGRRTPQRSLIISTLPGQKFRDKVKYTLPISAIYGLNIQSRAKMGIEIYKNLKYIVLAITFVEIFEI